jgi:hypothetical protein
MMMEWRELPAIPSSNDVLSILYIKYQVKF